MHGNEIGETGAAAIAAALATNRSLRTCDLRHAVYRQPYAVQEQVDRQLATNKFEALKARFTDEKGIDQYRRNVFDIRSLFEPTYSPPATLEEALQEARIEEVAAVANRVRFCAEKRMSEHRIIPITKEDAEVLAMWTYSFGNEESTRPDESINYDRDPYRKINRALFLRDGMLLSEIRGILFKLLSALRKLPRVSLPVLFRGINCAIDAEQYRPGSIVTWRSFSSTSQSIAKTHNFITARQTTTPQGTLFRIEQAWGYDMRPHSFVPEEEEILLEPDATFIVKNYQQLEPGFIGVLLEMTQFPLILNDRITPLHC